MDGGIAGCGRSGSGIRTRRWRRVVEGLSAGDRVIVHPPEKVKDGARGGGAEVGRRKEDLR
jgi:hypothetical protein